MRIDSMKGEFLYRALVKYEEDGTGFCLTDCYFRTKEDVRNKFLRATEILWPVDEVDRGVVYIPAPEELI